MENKKQGGFKLVEALLVVLLVFALAAVGLALLNYERAKVRDARRIADMVRVAAAFDVMFAVSNSYAGAALGCGQAGLLVSQCALQTYISDVTTIVDPGKGQYLVTGVPDDDSYEITFILERDYDTLKAGKHVVSELGIR